MIRGPLRWRLVVMITFWVLVALLRAMPRQGGPTLSPDQRALWLLGFVVAVAVLSVVILVVFRQRRR